MADEVIDHYIDRAGVKGDTDFLVGSLQTVYGEFKKIEALKVDFKGFAGLSSIGGGLQQAAAGADSLEAATKAVTDRIAQLNGKSKEFTDLLLKQTKAQKEAAAAHLLEAKAANENAKAKANETKETENAAKVKAADTKLAEQASNDYFNLAKAYNDAALKAKNYFLVLGEAHPVTVQAIKDANDIGDRVKKADAAVGQFQRNVGNYKSAFDGLGFSFAQVGRELPSLAISVQTFALAISNNLPIVADELKKATVEIARLKAEGQETPSLFQRIGKAIFSLQTLLSVGITLFTLFIGNLFKTGTTAKESTIYIKDLNRALEANKKAVDDAIDSLQYLNQLGRINVDIRFGDNAGADLQDLREQSVALRFVAADLRKAKNEVDQLTADNQKKRAEGRVTDEEYTKADAALSARRSEIWKQEAENGKQQILVYRQIQLQKDKDQRKAEEDAKKRGEDARNAAKDAKARADAELQARFSLKEIELKNIIDTAKEIADNEDESLVKRFAALKVFYSASAELINLNAELQKKLGEKTQTELKVIEAQRNADILALDKQLGEERIKIVKSFTKEWEAEEKRVGDAIEKGIEDRFKRFLEYLKKRKAAQDETTKEEEDKLKKKAELEKQLASELTTLTFTLFTASYERQKNAVQDQINALEDRKQKEIEVANATISNTQDRAAAIAIIEARAAAQKEELQRRQKEFDIKKAQFDKAQAIARIIQETAVALISSSIKPALIPLVIAISAAQLANVIAQPIPKYKHGKNVGSMKDLYEGPAWVDDGGRPEAIIREDGTVEVGGNKPRLTHLKKRDIVLPDARQLVDIVMAGKMGGVIMRRPGKGRDNSVENEIRAMRRDVVRAIQEKPVLNLNSSEGGLTAMWKHGANKTKYLNDQTNWSA